VALDGKGVNGPFAAALVKHLTVPGLDLRIAPGHVRDEVLAVTGNRQEPYFTGSLGGGTLALVAADARLVAPPPPPGDAAETVRICREVAAISSLATLGVLERQHKGRPAGECVAARIEEVRQQQAVVVAPRPVPGVGLPAQKSGAVPLTAAQERALKPKDSFKECDVCPEMVVVPAGSFMMGSVPGEMRYSFEDERPKHKVSLARPFAVAKFETTFGEWDACVADGGCQHRPDDKGWGRGSRPVINVSWDDIVNQYLPWLSRKTGKTYRLLTEAEWEYAARAGTTTAYYFGRNESLFCTYENVPDLTWKRQRYSANANCQHGYVAITAPVGSWGCPVRC
jgi:formylglycine-generating enzyme required for sulfatase activity